MPLLRVLVHLDDPDSVARRLLVARDLAELLDADILACRAVTPSRLRHGVQVGLTVRDVQACDQEDRERRNAAYEAFRVACGGAAHCQWLELAGEPAELVVRQALYADYLVLEQPVTSNDDCGVPPRFVDQVLVGSGKPALVLPHSGIVRPVPRTVAIAWSETREAAHAVASAAPLMRKASRVHILGHGEHAPAAVAALASRLRAQGLDPQAHCLDETGSGLGAVLTGRAVELGADLLVMGCYGHSPTRERILGGTTRLVLDTMRLPVLMAH